MDAGGTARDAPIEPAVEIRERLARRRESLARLGRSDDRLAAARLALFGLLLAAGLAVFAGPRLPWGWTIAPAAGFLVLVVLHDRVLRRLDRARRAAAFHEAALARVEDRWVGTGNPGDRFLDEDHPYAADLDLFGRGSLFELLCTARTRAGEERLAAWLLAPADRPEVEARQAAVAELAPRLDLREDLAVLGADVRSEVDPGRLASWGERPGELPARTASIAAAAAVAAFGTLALWIVGWTGGLPFLAAAAAVFGVQRLFASRVDRALGGLERSGRELEVLAAVLERLEREPLEGERLRTLQAATRGGAGVSAGRAVAVLGRWVGRLDWARNALFAPIAYLLLWRPHVALGIERWRRRHGAAVRRWLEALGEMEALGCLAGYAREHPADPFPALVVGPAFDAEGLGHPLMSAARCVRNDVRLDAGRRVLVVSGSNMSGKSTLLRSVGLAAVIALAGGPVRARRLSLSPLSVGATLRIRDSLRDGRSRFYAEVLRLRAIQEASRGPRPVLFLLDELLHGTNSRDRRIGGEALVRRLVESGAVGLLTTHDLALADLAETIPAVEVAHFEDEVRNGRPVFDFRLRPGVVDRSNAIELMRAAGLDV